MEIPWGVLGCCLGSGIFYLIGKKNESNADFLRSVIRVDQLKDLAVNILPLVVAVSGRVGSDEPITGEYSDVECVILKKTTEQHFLKKDDKGIKWIQDSKRMLCTWKEVPWYLDDGTARVSIVGATGLSLTTVGEVFEKTCSSCGKLDTDCGTSDNNQDLKMIGLKRYESVLPIGTRLTVVGKAVKDNGGNVRIRLPSYASGDSIGQLIDSRDSTAWWCGNISLGFAIFGLYLVTKNGVQYILERKREWKRRKSATAKRSGKDNTGKDEKIKNGSDVTRKIKLTSDCVVCLEQDYNSVFVPCGHMCCCLPCSLRLTNCPLCRRRIDQVVRTFRA